MPSRIDCWLLTHPRAVNLLHAAGLLGPRSQTRADELACLARHASSRRMAVEIGTFEGVSAAIIARALRDDGTLYCVDPWPLVRGRETPELTICRRHLRRCGVARKVKLLQGTSESLNGALPRGLDFAFIDGDHTFEGIATDWRVLRPKLATDAVVCLHDTTVPPDAPHRNFGSCRFFEEVIRWDPAFELIDEIYSLNVVRFHG